MNRSALVFGPAFLLLGVAGLLDDLGVMELRVGILLPVVLIIAGVVLATASLAEARR
jgi:hypothetical protein